MVCRASSSPGGSRDKQICHSRSGPGSDQCGVESLGPAGVPTVADLQGVTSRFDWRLERVVQFERPDMLPVEHDNVRATADLYSDCLMRELQRCRHC